MTLESSKLPVLAPSVYFPEGSSTDVFLLLATDSIIVFPSKEEVPEHYCSREGEGMLSVGTLPLVGDLFGGHHCSDNRS